ncbi:MAG: hypothetical protein HQM12_21430 [SAR324 cluster bacterium]|nr:hypothetical protein [SAR324 cluster bacterium]MBF0349802.1 hypothetical protein [SAR324 cluster bacterium]
MRHTLKRYHDIRKYLAAGWLFLNLIGSNINPILAQNQPVPPANAQGAAGPIVVNCKEPRNLSEGYQCFIDMQDKNIKRYEEYVAKQKEIQAEKEEQLLLKEQQRLAKIQQAEDERQRILETSRKRNLSRQGRKYKVTYGRITEPPVFAP